MSITGIFCAFFSLVAVFMDLKWEKVFNFWILGGWVCGVVLHLISGEMYSWRSFIGGTLTPIFLLFPLFIGKMLGTGDIKMFAVLGSVMGVKKDCVLSDCLFSCRSSPQRSCFDVSV